MNGVAVRQDSNVNSGAIGTYRKVDETEQVPYDYLTTLLPIHFENTNTTIPKLFWSPTLKRY